MPGKRKDFTGQKFGRLTAVKFIKRENRRTIWEFKCDCGITKAIRLDGVTSGAVRSCGCLQRETTAENGRRSSTKFIKGHTTHNKGKRMEEWLGEDQAKITRANFTKFRGTSKYRKFNKAHNDKLAEINKKPVLQMTLLGEIIHVHRSVDDTARAVGRAATSISRVCCHRGTSCAGYAFMFLDEYLESRQIVKIPAAIIKHMK